jgi:hypothetical protein
MRACSYLDDKRADSGTEHNGDLSGFLDCLQTQNTQKSGF